MAVGACWMLQATAQGAISWYTTRAQAVAAAQSSGKLILLVAGRNTCPNTQFMKTDMCERAGIRAVIDPYYVGWYCLVDTSTEHYSYTSGLGSYTLPLICVIDPADPLNYLDRSTNRQTDEAAFRARLLSHVNASGADAFEPDNTKAVAKRISNGQTQARSLLPEGDVDWAKFTINSFGAAKVRISTTGMDGDTQLGVWRASDGTQVAFSDDFGTSLFARVSLPHLGPGTYQIRVNGYNNVPVNAYALRATWYPGDRYEKDNKSSQAKTISNGQTQARNIHAAGDWDWAKFTIPAAGAHQVRLETAGASGDTQLRLYSQNAAGTGAGAQIAYNDNGGAENFSRITVAFMPAGTYYVRVQEKGNNETIAAYTLRATWTSP